MDLPRPFGTYTLLRRLAVGGMAEVYIAKARGIGGFEKLVAIKVIHPRYSEDDHFVTMLVEEAKLSVLLTHVNIAQTFDLGCIEGTYFIVMELVEGADTYKLLKRAAEVPAKIPVDIGAYIAAEVCQGLDYAHRKRDVTGAPLRIVHRDISPQNVLISFAGEVKIVDFGIAKAALRSGNTEVGVIKGKYYYMSPEQAWGDPVDQKSDIFSTGIVLHELLTGEMVYKEDNLPKLLDRVRKAEIVPPSRLRSNVPPALDAIVMKALAKHPEDRYDTAHDFGQALTQFLHGEMPTFTPSRLAGMMAQLFPAEIEATSSGMHLATGQKVLSSIHTADRDTATATDSVEPMKADEFRPDPKKSVIFDLGDDFGEEETSNQVPRALAAERAVKQQQAARDWDEPTTGQTPAAKSAATTDMEISADEETWEDATVVDDSDDLMERMKDLLQRQVAEKNRQGPPKSEDRTLPFDRAKLPPEVRAKAEAALKRAPLRGARPKPAPRSVPPRSVPPRSVPPPPPSAKAVAAARSQPPPPPAPASSWPPEGPSRPAARSPGAALPDLSWQASAEVQSAVAARPAAVASAAALDTHKLAAMTVEASRKRRRRVLAWIGIIAGVLLGVVALRTLSSEPVAPARLEVRSVPPGARVFFGGEQLSGETPLVVDRALEMGQSYPVQVQLDGYEAWSSSYEARPGSMSQIAVLVPIRVDVTVRTDPPGGRVWVDGIDHGSEPVLLERLPVRRTIRLRARIDGREVRQTHVVPPEGGEVVLSP